jgi:hypothetical protein
MNVRIASNRASIAHQSMEPIRDDFRAISRTIMVHSMTKLIGMYKVSRKSCRQDALEMCAE